MAGHIRIDGQDYTVTDPRQLTRQSANQMAAKLGQGAGSYDDLEDFTAVVWEDWRAGMGKKDAEGDGFYYAEADTRFKETLTLPIHVEPWPVEEVDPYGFFQIGTTSAYSKIASSQTITSGKSINSVDVYMGGTPGASVTLELRANSGGNPGTLTEAKTFTLDDRPGMRTYTVTFSTVTPGSDTVYHVVAYPTVAGNSLLVASGGALGTVWNGVAWVSGVAGLKWDWIRYSAGAAITKIVYFNGNAYAAAGTALYNISDFVVFSALTTFGASITDLMVLGDYLYIGLGDSTNYQRMNTSEAFVAGSVPARLWLLHGGFVYRAVNNYLYYTSDFTYWETLEVCFVGNSITAIAGQGNFVIISCTNGLYKHEPGDFIRKLIGYPTKDVLNGKGMINWQGNVYIPLGESIVQFDGEQMLPMGLDTDAGLPDSRKGTVTALLGTNQWLLVAISAYTATGTFRHTVWAYNGRGWHNMASLPATKGGVKTICLTDPETIGDIGITKLIYGTNGGFLYSSFYRDSGQSPGGTVDLINDGYHYYALSGWLETYWIHGGLREVYKTWESVFVDGGDTASISTTQYVDVYYMADDETTWTLLGTVTENHTELRWSDLTTRPTNRSIRLGFALYSTDSISKSPVIDAIRIKFKPMVIDRYRWQVPVEVVDTQVTLGGSINPRSTSTQLAHLDTLVNQVNPFVYQDIDGKQYEVQATHHTRTISKFDQVRAGRRITYVYSLTLEQVNSGEYVPT